MHIVGDAGTHKDFLAALTSTHGRAGRIEAWYNGAQIAEVEFESGSVKVTGNNRERRSIDDLVVAESLWPTLPTDTLSPYGVWLRAFVTVSAGMTTFPEIPVFAGKLHKVKRRRWSGQLQVTAKDPMWQVNREAFETLRRAPAGTRNVDAIHTLLVEVFPDATLEDQTGSTDTIPVATSWDARKGSRGAAIDALAAAIGAEVFARPTVVWPGGDFVIRPVPSLADPIAWTLPDGDVSIVDGDELEQSAEGVVNRWIVMSERTDATPIYVVVTDDDPASPTRYGGPMGKLPDWFSSPYITVEAQGQTAGRAKLSRSIGLARTRSVSVMANPALDAGDLLAIAVDGEVSETHIADDFSVPLTYDPASMSINTRSTGGDE